ncbi:sugar O-acetyltransferase [Vibrio gallaecicus]|uniref:sugar O-acetyltransferase n=1 Tax=Vibrio gallaecicus TaxID=552386 RepID=UPI0010C9C830|nr:sugar O-acetyltransferase [Vibrio gallaecicus]MDN3617731.1 sugar O-acetyltransferase [Vibrio gallaecicus]
MTEFEKMMAGEDYDGGDQAINDTRDNTSRLLLELNQTIVESHRQKVLVQLMREISATSIIRSPFHCEIGKTISIGKSSFINMNVTMLDGAKIIIGDNVLIGPNTQLYTASHSLNHLKRRQWATICKPISIEDDVWIGGNVVINQGVTIGARSVIAAGSVVNTDVPPDCLYGGTPAKLIRRID